MLLGTGSELHLAATSEEGCVLGLYLVKVSPHSHADAAQCPKHFMSTILTHPTPQEFNTVTGFCTDKEKIWPGKQLLMYR